MRQNVSGEKERNLSAYIHPFYGVEMHSSGMRSETVCRDYLRALIAPDFLTPL